MQRILREPAPSGARRAPGPSDPAPAWRVLRIEPEALADAARTDLEAALGRLQRTLAERRFAGLPAALAQAQTTAEGHGLGRSFRRWKARLVALGLEPRLGPFFTLPQVWKPYLMSMPAPGLRGTISTDRHGFRLTHGPDGVLDHEAFSRATSVPRGVVLGNSSVFGAGATDEGTVASRLNRRRAGLWLNLGLPSANLLQERLVVDAFLPEGVASVALVSGVNTLVYGAFADRFDEHLPVFERGHVFERLCNGAEPTSFPYPYPALPRSERERRLEAVLAHMRRGLRSLALECRARGARRIALFLQPIAPWTGKAPTPEEAAVDAACRDSLDFFFRALTSPFVGEVRERFAGALEAACASAGIDFVDLNRDPALAGPGWSFSDPIHWTDAATDRVAERVDAWSRS